MGRRAAGPILTSAGGEGGESVVCIDYSSAADAGNDDHHCHPSGSYVVADANDDDCSFCSEDETADDDADETRSHPADDEVVGGTDREIGRNAEGEGGESRNGDDASEYDDTSTSIQADETEGEPSTDDDEADYETTDDELTDGEWDITFVLMRDGCFVERCLERGVGS